MPTTQAPLTAAAIAATRREMQAALDGPSGLDDAGRVDAIRALEELACTVSAAQAALAADLADSVEADHEAMGVPSARRGQGVASQVAFARRESPHRGQRHLGLARIVRRELPHTWAAWRAGRITEWRATLIARETACLSLEHRLAVDEALAADRDALEAMSDRRVVASAQAQGTRLDAAAQVARRRKAESERRVSIRPAPDSMVWLTALLPVKDGVATFATLSKEADRARAHGDRRTRGQAMADSLVQSVLAGTIERTDDGGADGGTRDKPHTPPGAAGGATRGGVPVALGIVMTDAGLFGGADDAAHLEGFGPIPAELAREIICGAVSAEEQVSIRRLYTSPATGELLAMDARTRTFRGNLARFIRLRDRTCRTPWCDAPIRHIDHVQPHDAAGPTSDSNGQGLCEACNYAKQTPRWRARPEPDGSVTTTLPTGHTHSTRPPPLATVRRRDLPPLTIDYVLAG
ncbi:HNH endonuclease [Planomonospora venezuelensis]|nr:HNH endonuclease [Planomonospora venezuelensis]